LVLPINNLVALAVWSLEVLRWVWVSNAHT
jgi:hypothetical protein